MNHFIFDICFSMKTDKNLTEITEDEFRKAILERLNSLQAGELDFELVAVYQDGTEEQINNLRVFL